MQRPCVLIVDDNQDLAENISEILGDAGFQTRVYSDPMRATAEMKAGVYALALLDMRMPGMDGVELYRRLRVTDPGLPAIAMTAYARDEIINAALKEGVSAVMAKPVDFGALLSRVASVTGGSRVLLVEDDPALSQNLADILTEHGLSPRVARNAAEARALAQAIRPQVLVVDCRLPDAEGAALLRELAVLLPDAMRVLISGYPTDFSQVIRDAIAGGAEFLGKPLDIPSMLALVKRAQQGGGRETPDR